MLIQERACATCANKLTVNLFEWGSVCFNCRRRWRSHLAQRIIAADEWLLDLLSEAGMEFHKVPELA